MVEVAVAAAVGAEVAASEAEVAEYEALVGVVKRLPTPDLDTFQGVLRGHDLAQDFVHAVEVSRRIGWKWMYLVNICSCRFYYFFFCTSKSCFFHAPS